MSASVAKSCWGQSQYRAAPDMPPRCLTIYVENPAPTNHGRAGEKPLQERRPLLGIGVCGAHSRTWDRPQEFFMSVRSPAPRVTALPGGNPASPAGARRQKKIARPAQSSTAKGAAGPAVHQRRGTDQRHAGCAMGALGGVGAMLLGSLLAWLAYGRARQRYAHQSHLCPHCRRRADNFPLAHRRDDRNRPD